MAAFLEAPKESPVVCDLDTRVCVGVALAPGTENMNTYYIDI